MFPNLPVQTHVDLAIEFNRKRRIHVPEDPDWTARRARDLQSESSNSLAQRLFRSLAATFCRIRHRQPAQGESLHGATAHRTPLPR